MVKMKSKQMKALFLSLLVVLSCLGLQLFSVKSTAINIEDIDYNATYENEDFKYKYIEYTGTDIVEIEITGFTHSMPGEIIIPEEINGYKVVSFYYLDDSQEGLEYCKNITKIKFSQCISEVNLLSFYYNDENAEKTQCFENLREFDIDPNNPFIYSNDGVLFIKQYDYKTYDYEKGYFVNSGNYVTHLHFYPQKKNNITYTVPKDVNIIDFYSFSYNKYLKNITISDSVYYIEQFAFYGCLQLNNISLGDGLTGIGHNVFVNTAYSNDENNWEDAFLYDKSDKYLIQTKSYKFKEVVTVKEGTTLIEEAAFVGSQNIIEIQLPDSLKYISSYMCCDLTELLECKIPQNVISIGCYAFSGCYKLREININKNIRQIDTGAFSHCASISTYKVAADNPYFFSDSGVLFEKKDDGTLRLISYPLASNIKEYTISSNVSSIDATAFVGCSNLNSIKTEKAFEDCKNGDYYSYDGALYQKNTFEYVLDGEKVVCKNELMQFPSISNIKVKPGTESVTFSSPITNTTELNPRCIHIPKSVKHIEGLDKSCYQYIFFEGTKDEWNAIYGSKGILDYDSISEDSEVFVDDNHTTIFYNAYGDTLEEHHIYIDEKEMNIYNRFDDDSKGLWAQSSNKAFNEDVFLTVDSNFTQNESSQINVYSNGKNFEAYNVTIVNEYGVPINNINGSVKIYIPLPDTSINEYKIFHLNSNNQTEIFSTSPTQNEKNISIESVDGFQYLVIEVESFSPFVVTWDKVDTKDTVKSVKIDDVSLNYKTSTVITPKIEADKNAKYTISYSSSNPKIATVDEKGKISAMKKGTATITCSVLDSNGNVITTDTCKVTVSYTWWQWIVRIILFGWIWY